MKFILFQKLNNANYFFSVGSFIWTHLSNIKSSKSLLPYKKDLQNLFGSKFLQDKWKTDARKFSRQVGTSYYSDHLKIGGNFDGRLIFSESSNIPRSAMVNLTANIFGENINLFEVGARGEQFEDLIKQLSGPDGNIDKESFSRLLNQFLEKPNKNELNGENDDISPRGNIYLKIFSQDVLYSSFKGINFWKSYLGSFWPMSFFSGSQEFFDKNQNLAYERSTIFLDGKIEVPTIAGLPLHVDINGVSSVSLTSKHNIDFANLFSLGTGSFSIEFSPSVSLQVCLK